MYTDMGKDKMLRVMQIGYGYWGTNVTKKLMASRMFELVYLVETDAQRRQNAREKVAGSVRILDSYEDAVKTDIDVVVICTQTECSYAIAMEAMAQGKHIFIEKPIATNVERTRSLIDRAKENRLILHCDHLMVYNPVVRYIKRMIESDEVGDIMYIDISRINLGPIRKDINAMLDLAVHDIAVIDYLMGGLIPEYLSACGRKLFGEKENITYLTMKCGETLININSSWVSPVKVRRMLIGGTKRMLIFDDLKMDKLSIYNSGIDVEQGSEYGEYEYKTRVGDIFIPHIENVDSLLSSLEHFGECVLKGEESLSGPAQSLRVMQVLEQAQKALDESR